MSRESVVISQGSYNVLNYSIYPTPSSYLSFQITVLSGSCGTVICAGVSYTDNIFDNLSRKDLAIMFLKLFQKDQFINVFSKKNILLFTDSVGGYIMRLFNVLLPNYKWSLETVLGININTNNTLVVRHINTATLKEIIREEEEKEKKLKTVNKNE